MTENMQGIEGLDMNKAGICRVGIDAGSAYTKYCICENGKMDFYTERTPVRQKEHFTDRLRELQNRYPKAAVVSCGYGKKNIAGMKQINELTALAMGSFWAAPGQNLILDIGGQDTKVICQQGGRLKEFFVNERCAAGSGLFLSNTARLLEIPLEKLDLSLSRRPEVHLSSVCAVFAQSEIVELVAENIPAEEILRAVVWQIFTQAKLLLGKVKKGPILLSGGLTEIKGLQQFAQLALEQECIVPENGRYLSAIGCMLA